MQSVEAMFDGDYGDFLRKGAQDSQEDSDFLATVPFRDDALATLPKYDAASWQKLKGKKTTRPSQEAAEAPAAKRIAVEAIGPKA